MDAGPRSDGIDRCLVSHPASTPADDEECPGHYGEGLAIRENGWNLESEAPAGACPPGHVPARYPREGYEDRELADVPASR